jgi:hypothetical protein
MSHLVRFAARSPTAHDARPERFAAYSRCSVLARPLLSRSCMSMNDPIPPSRAIQGAVRAALSAADELSRHEHDEHAENTAQHLAALRTTLAMIDARLGVVEKVEERLVDELHNVVLKLRRLGEDDSPVLDLLLDEAELLEQRLRGRAQATVSSDMSSLRQSIWDGLRAMRRPPVVAGMLIGAGVLTGAIAFTFALRRRS